MLLGSDMCYIACAGRNGICLCFRWGNPIDSRFTTLRERLTARLAEATEMIQKLLDIWEDIKPTWTEIHAFIIGWGDGAAFTWTDWDMIHMFYDDGLEGELHYYKFGIGLGRLTWALIIASLLIRFLD